MSGTAMCPMSEPTSTRLPASWPRRTGSTWRARLTEPCRLVAQHAVEDLDGDVLEPAVGHDARVGHDDVDPPVPVTTAATAARRRRRRRRRRPACTSVEAAPSAVAVGGDPGQGCHAPRASSTRWSPRRGRGAGGGLADAAARRRSPGRRGEPSSAPFGDEGEPPQGLGVAPLQGRRHATGGGTSAPGPDTASSSMRTSVSAPDRAAAGCVTCASPDRPGPRPQGDRRARRRLGDLGVVVDEQRPDARPSGGACCRRPARRRRPRASARHPPPRRVEPAVAQHLPHLLGGRVHESGVLRHGSVPVVGVSPR